MNSFRSVRLGLGLIGLVLVTLGCGGSAGSSVARSINYRGTQAPGDVWSYTIGAETFTATNSTLSHDYAGSVSSLPSGFKKLTMATTNDPDVHAGDVAYSVEIPDTALLVKPVNGAAIVACGLGDQPTGSSLQYNWVSVPEENWTASDSSAYGMVSFTSTGTTFTGEVTAYLTDGTVKNHFEDSFTYSGGNLTQPESPDLNGAITPSGTFMLDFGPQHGGGIGVKRPSAPLDPNDISNRTFIGISVNRHNSNCVQAVGDGHGTFAANDFTDVEMGALSSDPEHSCSVTLGTQIAPGLFRATLTAGTDSFAMIVTANKASGKWILYAFGTDDGAYNVMLVER